MRPADRLALPTAITIAGLALGVVGLAIGVEHGWPLLLASIACDLLDGFVARQLGTVTLWGAHLDYHVDATLGIACLWRALPASGAAAWTVPVVIVQAVMLRGEARFSGRIAIFLGCILVYAAR